MSPTRVIQLLGEEIRVRRHQLSLTQEALAINADLSTTVVRRLECGRANNVTLNTLLDIATALHTSVFDLFSSAARRPQPPPDVSPAPRR